LSVVYTHLINYYGHAIKRKEEVVHQVFAGKPDLRGILIRGGYYTDLTYSGVEEWIDKIIDGKPIDFAEKAHLNLLTNRDAAIAMILSLRLADNPVPVLNLAGAQIDISSQIGDIESELRKHEGYEHLVAQFEPTTVTPYGLIANGQALIYAISQEPVDLIRNIERAQVHWIANGGYRRNEDQHVGAGMSVGKG
jgi:hypothetical protein